MRWVEKEYQSNLDIQTIYVDGKELLVTYYDKRVEYLLADSPAAEEAKAQYLQDILSYTENEHTILDNVKTKNIRSLKRMLLVGLASIGAVAFLSFVAVNPEMLKFVNNLLHDRGINQHYSDLAHLKIEIIEAATIASLALSPTITSAHVIPRVLRGREMKKLAIFRDYRDKLTAYRPQDWCMNQMIVPENFGHLGLGHFKKAKRNILAEEKREQQQQKRGR